MPVKMPIVSYSQIDSIKDYPSGFVDYETVKKIICEITNDYSDRSILHKLKGKNISKLLCEYNIVDVSDKVLSKGIIYSILKAIELERKDKRKNDSKIVEKQYKNALQETSLNITVNNETTWGSYMFESLDCLNIFKQLNMLKNNNHKNNYNKINQITKNQKETCQELLSNNVRQKTDSNSVQLLNEKKLDSVQQQRHLFAQVLTNKKLFTEASLNSDMSIKSVVSDILAEPKTYHTVKIMFTHVKYWVSLEPHLCNSLNTLFTFVLYPQQHGDSIESRLVSCSTQTSYMNNEVNLLREEDVDCAKTSQAVMNTNCENKSNKINNNRTNSANYSPAQIYEVCMEEVRRNTIPNEYIYSSSRYEGSSPRSSASDLAISLSNQSVKDDSNKVFRKVSDSRVCLTLEDLTAHLKKKNKNKALSNLFAVPSTNSVEEYCTYNRANCNDNKAEVMNTTRIMCKSFKNKSCTNLSTQNGERTSSLPAGHVTPWPSHSTALNNLFEISSISSDSKNTYILSCAGSMERLQLSVLSKDVKKTKNKFTLNSELELVFGENIENCNEKNTAELFSIETKQPEHFSNKNKSNILEEEQSSYSLVQLASKLPVYTANNHDTIRPTAEPRTSSTEALNLTEKQSFPIKNTKEDHLTQHKEEQERKKSTVVALKNDSLSLAEDEANYSNKNHVCGNSLKKKGHNRMHNSQNNCSLL